MKTAGMIVVIAGVLTLTMLPGAYAAYEEGVLPELKLEASATMDVYNKYMWRGFTLDTDPVFQPGFNISGYGLTVSFWGSYDASGRDSLASDEQDFIIDYTFETEYAAFSVGHTYYYFPGSTSYSTEWYLGASLPVMLSPTITYYYDYGDEDQGGGDGQYVNFSISHSLTVVENPEITLDLGASVGLNNELFIKGEGGDYLLTVGLTIPLTPKATLSPVFGYAAPFGDLKDTNDGNQKARTYGGVSVGVTF